ncbi:MAG TPA: DUF2292 domain-containing protein [Bacilli bacterium]|nr:DUF2292 domain-containing protein [Bacilli bacterium]
MKSDNRIIVIKNGKQTETPLVKHGSITLFVQDGKVLRSERLEKDKIE